jgi:hypothetical protein
MREVVARACLLALVLPGAMLLPSCGEDDRGGAADEIRAEDIVRERELKLKARRIERLERRLRQGDRAVVEDPAPSTGNRRLPSGLRRIARQMGGEVGAAVGLPGSAPAVTAGAVFTGSAWSTIKVPIALRVLEDAGGPGGLTDAQRSQIERALTLSNNAAAAHLFAGLGQSHGGASAAAGAVTELLRQSGDPSTVVSTEGRDGFSSYGQTDWSLVSQAQFMSAVSAGCLGSSQSRELLLDLMGRVTSDTWGLGSAGVPARWKGGWGPDADGRYLVRQMGIIHVGGRDLAVAIAAKTDDGQSESAQQLATATAQWIVQNGDAVSEQESLC